MDVEIAGENLQLLPERALFWPREELLVIADTHFGKAATFRAAGIPVPEAMPSDLRTLDTLIDRVGARRLAILGDYFHAPEGRTTGVHEWLAEWRRGRRDLEVILVSGNHDRRAGPPPKAWDFLVAQEWERAPFVFRHEPGESDRGYVLAGHLHPAVKIRDRRLGSMKLPCFWFGKACGVLPAFGSFTGTHPIEEAPGDRVFALADGELLEIPAGLLAR